MNLKKLKCIKEVKVAENKFVQVNMDIVEFTKGVEGTHVKVSPKNNGGIVLFVKNQNNHIYLQYSYHYATDDIYFEFIRGTQDDNEERIFSAKRELGEEILFNYELSSEPIFLGNIYPDTTILNSYASLYLIEMKSKEKLSQHKDILEPIFNGEFYPIEKLSESIANGKITDGYTLSSYAILKAKNMI